LLFPAELPVSEEPLIGAAAVHQLMKGWVAGTNVATGEDDEAANS
jgi:hypothetical protein